MNIEEIKKKYVADYTMPDEVRYLLSIIEQAEKTLKKVEWIGANHEIAGALECSCCGSAKEDGHNKSCIVAVALQAIKGE